MILNQDNPAYGGEIPPEVYDIAAMIIRFIGKLDGEFTERENGGEEDE